MTSRRSGWVIFGLTQILLALGVSLQILGGGRQVLRQGMFLVLVGLVFPAVGAFIVSRRPGIPSAGSICVSGQR